MEQIINTYYANNAEKLHNLVDRILFKLRFNVDNQDFYSLANEIFVDVLKRYDKQQSFDGFLYSCLLNKFKTEMTRRNRIKRQADMMSIPIDTPIKENDRLTIGDILVAENTVEEEIFEDNQNYYSCQMNQYLNRLSLLQKEVLHLISIGFSPNEIIEELHINKKQYEDCYAAIHSYRNIAILL